MVVPSLICPKKLKAPAVQREDQTLPTFLPLQKKKKNLDLHKRIIFDILPPNNLGWQQMLFVLFPLKLDTFWKSYVWSW